MFIIRKIRNVCNILYIDMHIYAVVATAHFKFGYNEMGLCPIYI